MMPFTLCLLVSSADNFCNLLITFANSLEPDQAWQNVGPENQMLIYGLVVRKPQMSIPACAYVQSDVIGSLGSLINLTQAKFFDILPSLCSWTVLLESCLVTNSDDSITHHKAHLAFNFKFPKSWTFEMPILKPAVRPLNIHNFNFKWSIDLRQTEKNKMKKVNKQCLLDTPRTVRKKEKLTFWQVIVQTSRP